VFLIIAGVFCFGPGLYTSVQVRVCLPAMLRFVC
jgi:hypothetical protein